LPCAVAGADQDRGPRASDADSLYVGIIGPALLVYVFAFAYAHIGETTRAGWWATFAAGFELSGLLLVASPELRPIVEALARRIGAEVRTWPNRLRNVLRGLMGKGRIYEGAMTATVSLSGTVETEVIRGFEDPPPAEAPAAEQIAYLLRVTERTKEVLHGVENDLRKGIENVRGEIQRTALDLTEHTANAVQELAHSELQMRLLGVLCIAVGLVFSYLANIA
jgi:hypothetical protein